MEKDQQLQQKQVVHEFNQEQGIFTRNVIIIFVMIALFGVGTGYLGSIMIQKKGLVSTSKEGSKSSTIENGTIFGSKDTETFKDATEGLLKSGGMDGEGAFHLERPGGASQNVYLTSSVIDLSQFENRRVKVWGETNKAKKAGWLMDVGKLQIIE